MRPSLIILTSTTNTPLLCNRLVQASAILRHPAARLYLTCCHFCFAEKKRRGKGNSAQVALLQHASAIGSSMEDEGHLNRAAAMKLQEDMDKATLARHKETLEVQKEWAEAKNKSALECMAMLCGAIGKLSK